MYYSLFPEQYRSSKQGDSFMQSLADGGFQVGELAKCYFPEGINAGHLATDEALAVTKDLLSRENVVIFEAALRWGNSLIRVDILEKRGRYISLNEVKARSVDFNSSEGFRNSRGIIPAWRSCLEDIAFQKFVAIKAFPGFIFKGNLYLVDKTSVATVDGLNQMFRLVTENTTGRRSAVTVKKVTNKDVGRPILTLVNVDDLIEDIYEKGIEAGGRVYGYADYVRKLEDICRTGVKPECHPGAFCKHCEFKDSGNGYESGFYQCWNEAYGLTRNDLQKDLVFEIGNIRSEKADKYIRSGKFFIEQIDPGLRAEDLTGELDRAKRKALQIIKVKRKDKEPYFYGDGFLKKAGTWKYPFHFIDFETATVAVPYKAGLHPYEVIAFQFSHHIMNADGSVIHKEQFINIEPGYFPNFDFVRKLKDTLSTDDGTIFRYAAHENTVLNAIHKQLINAGESVPDRDELIEFIESISHSSGSSDVKWQGKRDMVDMLDLVKLYYYHPIMKGSNSIKKVLPAVLNSSTYIKNKYSKPVYGTTDIPSFNYKAHVWVRKDSQGSVIDPYNLLAQVAIAKDGADAELFQEHIINNGGEAMTAYGRAQFTETTDEERDAIRSSLLKYCELDTWAMVVIMEYWLYEALKQKEYSQCNFLA
jgi:hypothetical protein